MLIFFFENVIFRHINSKFVNFIRQKRRRKAGKDMKIIDRNYQKELDYNKVLSFLRKEYKADPHYPGWKAQRFEDMEYRLNVMYICMGSTPWHQCIHLWEEDGAIVGLCVGERKGENFFYVKKEYEFLYPQMLDWTKKNMFVKEDGKKEHTFWVCDVQQELIDILRSQQFKRSLSDVHLMEHTMKDLQEPVLPEGFRLVYGTEMKDIVLKTNISHWGFNPNQEGIENTACTEANKNRTKAPMFDEQFEIMTQDPNGELCSYAYFWLDTDTKSAFVEPVSTREKYRKCGLGKAMLLAALHRCKEKGITCAYVEPFDKWRERFYASVGFKTYGKMGIWTLSEKI